jgi:hypothetical protein
MRPNVSFEREIVLPHVQPIRPATHVRSTLIQSSLKALKARGHEEGYLRALDPKFRDQIISSVAPTWLPIEVGAAHYGACDSLHFGQSELLDIGEAVGDRVQGVFISPFTQAAKVAKISPWVALKYFDKIWVKIFQGGSIELIKVGPKDLLIDIREAQLPRYEYFRIGFCGVVKAAFKLGGTKTVQVTTDKWSISGDRLSIRASWV